MSTYLFRNPQANYKVSSINRRLDRLRNYPIVILFSFILGFLTSYAHGASTKALSQDNEFEKFNVTEYYQKKLNNLPPYIKKQAR